MGDPPTVLTRTCCCMMRPVTNFLTVATDLEFATWPRIQHGQLRRYSIKESGFGYAVNPNLDSVKKLHSINESKSGFGESCLNPVLLRHFWILFAMWIRIQIHYVSKSRFFNRISPYNTSSVAAVICCWQHAWINWHFNWHIGPLDIPDNSQNYRLVSTPFQEGKEH